METKTTLGLHAGYVAALLFVGTYFGNALFLAVAVAYIAIKETNTLLKTFAKYAVALFLIEKACRLFLSAISYFGSLFDIEGITYGTVMPKIGIFVDFAYLIATVVFAIIGLVKGLPHAERPVYVQPQVPPQTQAQPQPQTTRTCPGCNLLLAGPGICPKCGTKVD